MSPEGAFGPVAVNGVVAHAVGIEAIDRFPTRSTAATWKQYIAPEASSVAVWVKLVPGTVATSIVFCRIR